MLGASFRDRNEIKFIVWNISNSVWFFNGIGSAGRIAIRMLRQTTEIVIYLIVFSFFIASDGKSEPELPYRAQCGHWSWCGGVRRGAYSILHLTTGL